MKPFIIKKICGFIPKIGDRIHLYSIQGHYEIVEILSNGVTITCKVWQARASYPQQKVVKFVEFKGIKALHGYNNLYQICNKVNINANATNR